MSCLTAVITRNQNNISVSFERERENLGASVFREYTDTNLNLTRKQVSISIGLSRVCDVFTGQPLYVADGQLYASDVALYVNIN